ncbi:MAG: T9SS type A sorting domain-containing protein, partial [Saprospiraceae bacterium]
FLDPLTPNGGPILPVPHNVYIKDNLLFDSQYEDGLLVYDISAPTQPVLVAHYDTHPENTVYNRYFGNWGNYPWLPSGTIIAGDMQNGLFLLKLAIPSATQQPDELNALVSPNPAHTTLSVQVPQITGDWSYQLLNPAGRLVRSATGLNGDRTDIRVAELPAGLYFLRIQTVAGNSTIRKIMVN